MALKPSREIAFPFRIGPHGGIAFVEDEYQTYFQHLVVVILTGIGERVMLPGFGTRVREYLFENIDGVISAELVIRVQEAVAKWEPAVVIHDIAPVLTELAQGALVLEIQFSVPPRQDVLSTVVDVGGALTGEDRG